MKATLLTMATIRSGTIVFMKNDENTRNAADQAATTIHISHLDSSSLAQRSPRSTRAFKRRADVSSGAGDAPSHDFRTGRDEDCRVGSRSTTNDRPSDLAPIVVGRTPRGPISNRTGCR